MCWGRGGGRGFKVPAPPQPRALSSGTFKWPSCVSWLAQTFAVRSVRDSGLGPGSESIDGNAERRL